MRYRLSKISLIYSNDVEQPLFKSVQYNSPFPALAANTENSFDHNIIEAGPDVMVSTKRVCIWNLKLISYLKKIYSSEQKTREWDSVGGGRNCKQKAVRGKEGGEKDRRRGEDSGTCTLRMNSKTSHFTLWLQTEPPIRNTLTIYICGFTAHSPPITAEIHRIRRNGLRVF